MNINFSYKQIFMNDVNHYIDHGFPSDSFTRLYRGVKPIESADSLRLYNALYGGHHIAKFKMVLPFCLKFVNANKKYSIVDWACGQGLASSMLIDSLNYYGKLYLIDKIYLIEPSSVAVDRALNILQSQFDNYGVSRPDIVIKKQYFNETKIEDLNSKKHNYFIHLFSNALDTNVQSTEHIMSIIKNLKNNSLIAATSPNYGNTELAYLKMKKYLNITNVEHISNNSGYTSAKVYMVKYGRWSISNIAYNQCILRVVYND